MANALKLWISAETGRLLSGLSSFVNAQPIVFHAGDTVPLELHLLAGTGVSKAPYEIPFPAGATTTVAIGKVATAPLSGQWRLSVDGTETADIPFDAEALQVQTALNAIPLVSSLGGVVVESLGGGYSITWNSIGTKPPILAGSDTLAPASYEAILTLQAGDVSTREIIFVELRQTPLAMSTDFVPIGSPSINVATVSAWNGVNKIVRVTILNNPKSGFWTMTMNAGGATPTNYIAGIKVGATVSEIKTAIYQALGVASSNYLQSVIQSGENQYDFVFGINYSVSVNGSGMVASNAIVGSISLATSELIAFLGNQPSADVKLEIITTSGSRQTTLSQATCYVANAVVAQGAIGPVPVGTLLTESVANARFVRKDVVDAPSTASQDILWQNLGVTQDGSDTVDAINAAASPASGNPFLTVSAADAAYSPIFDQSLNTTNTVNFASVISDAGAIKNLYTGDLAGGNYTELKNNGDIELSGAAVIVGYLKSSDAASTYATISSLSSYLTTASASSTYQTISGMSSYLTTASASSTYALLSSFDQGVTTTSDVSFNSLSIASGSFQANPAWSQVNLTAGWAINVQGMGGDTILNWDGLTVAGSTGVTLSGGGSIVFSDSSTMNTRVVKEHQANGSGFSTGGFDTSHYPYEVKVIDDTGTAYWVPARLA